MLKTAHQITNKEGKMPFTEYVTQDGSSAVIWVGDIRLTFSLKEGKLAVTDVGRLSQRSRLSIADIPQGIKAEGYRKAGAILRKKRREFLKKQKQLSLRL